MPETHHLEEDDSDGLPDPGGAGLDVLTVGLGLGIVLTAILLLIQGPAPAEPVVPATLVLHAPLDAGGRALKFGVRVDREGQTWFANSPEGPARVDPEQWSTDALRILTMSDPTGVELTLFVDERGVVDGPVSFTPPTVLEGTAPAPSDVEPGQAGVPLRSSFRFRGAGATGPASHERLLHDRAARAEWEAPTRPEDREAPVVSFFVGVEKGVMIRLSDVQPPGEFLFLAPERGNPQIRVGRWRFGHWPASMGQNGASEAIAHTSKGLFDGFPLGSAGAFAAMAGLTPDLVRLRKHGNGTIDETDEKTSLLTTGLPELAAWLRRDWESEAEGPPLRASGRLPPDDDAERRNLLVLRQADKAGSPAPTFEALVLARSQQAGGYRTTAFAGRVHVEPALLAALTPLSQTPASREFVDAVAALPLISDLPASADGDWYLGRRAVLYLDPDGSLSWWPIAGLAGEGGEHGAARLDADEAEALRRELNAIEGLRRQPFGWAAAFVQPFEQVREATGLLQDPVQLFR